MVFVYVVILLCMTAYCINLYYGRYGHAAFDFGLVLLNINTIRMLRNARKIQLQIMEYSLYKNSL